MNAPVPKNQQEANERFHSLAPQPGMQEQACMSAADELLLGGQAGPGKSWFLLFEDLEDCIRFSDLRTLILRKDTPQLAQLLEEAQEMYEPFGARFSGKDIFYQKPTWTFPCYNWVEDEDGNITEIHPILGTSGAKVIFGHCEKESDKYKYGGFEFQRLKFDELANFPESIYLFLFSRLRTTNPKIACTVRGTCNPVGIGMLWVKRRFVDKIAPGELKAFRRVKGKDTEFPLGTPETFARSWIPGIRADNKYITRQYEAALGQLGSRDFAALAEGSWEFQDVPNQLISAAWFDRACSGDVKEQTGLEKNRYAVGADCAHMGVDLAAICTGKGNKPTRMESFEKTSTQDMAYVIQRALSRCNRKSTPVGVDSVGPGAGVGDLLDTGAKKVTLSEPFGSVEVDIRNIGGQLFRCVHKDPIFDLKYRGALTFPNFRSQMYWKLRVDLQEGNIDLSEAVSSEKNFKDFSLLQEEVLAHTFESRDGKIWVISKEILRKEDNLGRSPNYADAFAIWNWVRERKINDEEALEEEFQEVDVYMKDFNKEDEEYGEHDRREKTTLHSSMFV